MDKPQKVKREMYDYNKCRDYLEAKYGYSERDYAGKFKEPTAYTKWLDSKGYGEKDPDGQSRDMSRIWFTEYQDALANGEVTEPPYLDFWHWVIDHHQVNNPCVITFTQEELDEIEEDWVREIYSHYMDEFAENGELTMNVWW